MKKQKTNSKLTFESTAIVELNDNQLQQIGGGSLFSLIKLASQAVGAVTQQALSAVPYKRD
ncbi:class I lanthipeptide [Flavobacterium sp. CAU 1735]|uniref:class I lanthipeptide n=1 Tax=Flavobacterium sp. CAU 1735 TaxID=3140361 RepID=UPI0032608808